MHPTERRQAPTCMPMGTISVRYAWRARPNSAPDRPMAKTAAPSIHTLCASSAAAIAAASTAAATRSAAPLPDARRECP